METLLIALAMFIGYGIGYITKVTVWKTRYNYVANKINVQTTNMKEWESMMVSLPGYVSGNTKKD